MINMDNTISSAQQQQTQSQTPQQPPQVSQQQVPPQQQMPSQMPPNAVPLAYYPPMPAPVPAAEKKSKLKEKSQSAVFSTIVKALCLLILLAFFLPFATVSCGPMVSYSVTGYDLAFGGAAYAAAELSQGNMGLGMGMGAGQLAALNMLAGVNLLLVAAFVGTALLLTLSLTLGRTKLELMFSLVVAAFSLAAYLQWLGIFSAFTDMFARAQELGGEAISAGPDIGLYAVITFSSLLLLAAALESIGRLPAFLTKGEEGTGASPMIATPTTLPAGMYYSPMQQPIQQPMQGQGQHQQPQQMPMYAPMQPTQQEQSIPTPSSADSEQSSSMSVTEPVSATLPAPQPSSHLDNSQPQSQTQQPANPTS